MSGFGILWLLIACGPLGCQPVQRFNGPSDWEASDRCMRVQRSIEASGRFPGVTFRCERG